MKKRFSSLLVVLFTGLLFYTACKKDHTIIPFSYVLDRAVDTPKAPVARAGNDTTIYLPFSSYKLNGWASTDPGSKITSYAWRKVASPLALNDTVVFTSSIVFLSGIVNVGTYEYELTVTNANGLTSKDTIKINIAEPTCTGTNKEIILKDLYWDYSWIMEIDIYNLFSLLPPNSYLKNIYIKRDGSGNWEKVMPMGTNSGNVPEWLYGNSVLVIFPGSDTANDTPDIKIEYCN